HRRPPPDGGELAGRPITKRRGRGFPGAARRDEPADIAPPLLCGPGGTRSHRTPFVMDRPRVAHHAYLRMVRAPKIGAGPRAAAWSAPRDTPAGARRGTAPGAQEDGAGIVAPAIEVHAAPIAIDAARGAPHADPNAHERALGIHQKICGKRGQEARPRLEQ